MIAARRQPAARRKFCSNRRRYARLGRRDRTASCALSDIAQDACTLLQLLNLCAIPALILPAMAVRPKQSCRYLLSVIVAALITCAVLSVESAIGPWVTGCHYVIDVFAGLTMAAAAHTIAGRSVAGSQSEAPRTLITSCNSCSGFRVTGGMHLGLDPFMPARAFAA